MGDTLLSQHQCPAECFVEHWLNGVSLGTGATAGPVSFATAATPFTVGHSAFYGTSFTGWIADLLVDPGNLVPIDPN